MRLPGRGSEFHNSLLALLSIAFPAGRMLSLCPSTSSVRSLRMEGDLPGKEGMAEVAADTVGNVYHQMPETKPLR